MKKFITISMAAITACFVFEGQNCSILILCSVIYCTHNAHLAADHILSV